MRIAWSCAASLLIAASQPAAADALLRLERPEIYDLRVEGFELPRKAEVAIDAVGLRDPRADGWIERLWRDADADLTVYAWILDSATRQPVWTMDDGSGKRRGNLRESHGTVTLAPGRYELYLFSGNLWADQIRDRVDDDDSSWWSRLSSHHGRRDRLVEDLEACGVEVAIRGVSDRELKRFEVDGTVPGALIARNRLGDSAYGVDGFRLDRPGTLRVYGLIEHRDDDRDASDSIWIVNADTRELVFDASDARTRPGGGGDKNRRVDDEIDLAAGRYLLYHGTDDSHSFDEFNVGAPWDPYNWGVTLLPGKDFDPATFQRFEPETSAAWIEMTKIGDSRTVEQAFRLERDTQVWVEALGEWDDDDRVFYDGAGILDADTGDIVWEMTERNTRGAGGASKNRMFDGLVALPAGDYVLYYSTDGSHSWEDWNAATPFRPYAWGVSLRPAPGAQPAGLRVLDERELLESSGSIARLVGVGDHARERQEFTLDARAKLRIEAMGEGRSGRMYDYAYIVDESTGRSVWEMDYRATRHAGGADKNRLAVEDIELDPGTYEVIYVTDGSHSAEGWNSAPPRRPHQWGVIVRRR